MSTLNWEGISIAVSHTSQAFNGPFDHLEIKCGQVLPITETGYRSHFLAPEELELFDSPEAFVLEWLNHAAEDPQWKAQEFNSRQGELF